MGREIERKFLVTSSAYREGAKKVFIRQGFLNNDPMRVVRVRVSDGDSRITIKGPSEGFARLEFEYPIPRADAEEILQKLCIPNVISKNRFIVKYGNITWEVDEFLEENEGLVIAEVELPKESFALDLPDWIGPEVTGDFNYYNASLATHPYRRWKQGGKGGKLY